LFSRFGQPSFLSCWFVSSHIYLLVILISRLRLCI
jgi:hypothetical protein